MTEIRIAISPETLALLEISMTQGDTYDAVIRRLMKTPWVKKSDGKNTWFESEQRAIIRHDTDCTIKLPEGISIDPGAITELQAHDEYAERRDLELSRLAFIARAVRDDIAKSIDLAELKRWGEQNMRVNNNPFQESACSAVMKTENVLALEAAVKAVFDE